MKVDQATRIERLNICRGCEHYTPISKTKGSCGPFLIGKRVSVKARKNKAKLCGCIMEVKTWLKAARCPIGEWKATDPTKEDKAFMKEAKDFVSSVYGKETLTGDEVKKLYSFHNVTNGSKKSSTGCGKCVKTALEELKEWTDSA